MKENFENGNNFDDYQDGQLVIKRLNLDHLIEAGKWSRILGIFGLIFSVIYVFGAIGLSITMLAMVGSTVSFIGFGLLYIGFGVYIIFVSLSLLKFGKFMKELVLRKDQNIFDKGIEQLKRYFKLVGIGTLAIIGLYLATLISMMVLNFNAFI